MIKTNYLKTILYWLIVASLLAPLVAFRHYFSDPIFFKTMVFFGIVDIMIVVYGIMLARGQIAWPKSTWLNWSVLGFLIILLVSLFTSTQPYVSFWGSSDRIMGFLTWFHLGAYFYIVSMAIRTKTDWSKLFKIIIISSIFVSLYALGQYFNVDALVSANSSRVASVMTNPLFLSGYYMVITPLTIFCLWLSKKNLWKIVSGLALALQLVTIVATVSRSPVVALAVASIFTIFVYAWTQKSKKLFIWGVIIMVLMGGLWGTLSLNQNASFVQDNALLQKISKISLNQSTSQTRIALWQQGIKAWQQRPVLGWGLENFNVAYDTNYIPGREIAKISETWSNRAHNFVVDWLVTVGVLGLLGYLIVVLGALWASIKILALATTRWEKMVGLMGVAVITAYLTFNFFVFDLITSVTYFFLVLALINVFSEKVSETSIKPRPWAWIIVIAGLLAIYPFSIRSVLASDMMGNATKLFLQGRTEESILRFENSLSYGSFINNHSREEMLLSTIRNFSNLEELRSRQDVDAQLRQIISHVGEEEAREREPHLARPYSNMLTLYSRWVSWDASLLLEGEEVLKQAEEMGPRRPNTQILAGQMYLAVDKDDLALASFKKGIDILPSWGRLYYAAALVLGKQGNLSEMNRYLDLAKENGFVLKDPLHVQSLVRAVTYRASTVVVNQYRERFVAEAVVNLTKEVEQHMSKKNWAIAYGYVNSLLKLDPDNVRGRSWVRELYNINNKYTIPI